MLAILLKYYKDKIFEDKNMWKTKLSFLGLLLKASLKLKGLPEPGSYQPRFAAYSFKPGEAKTLSVSLRSASGPMI